MNCEVYGFEEDCILGVGLLDVFWYAGRGDGGEGGGRGGLDLHYCVEDLVEEGAD